MNHISFAYLVKVHHNYLRGKVSKSYSKSERRRSLNGIINHFSRQNIKLDVREIQRKLGILPSPERMSPIAEENESDNQNLTHDGASDKNREKRRKSENSIFRLNLTDEHIPGSSSRTSSFESEVRLNL